MIRIVISKKKNLDICEFIFRNAAVSSQNKYFFLFAKDPKSLNYMRVPYNTTAEGKMWKRNQCNSLIIKTKIKNEKNLAYSQWVLLLHCRLWAYIISESMLIELWQLNLPWDKRVPPDWEDCCDAVATLPCRKVWGSVSSCPSVIQLLWCSQIWTSLVLIIHFVGCWALYSFFLSTGLQSWRHQCVGWIPRGHAIDICDFS